MCVIDSVQVLYDSALSGAPGSVGPGARGRRPHHARGEGARHRHAAGRPRDQGGLAGGAARARAPGRLRALVRGRARAHLPHAARAQEPLRLDQRGGRVRDGRAGPRRGRGRLASASSARPRARPARWCSARWRARGRCWSRCRRWWRPASWCRRGASPTGSTATGWRWCWPCWPATAASGSARATCSCRWPAACAWTSRAPTWRSRWRWRRRRRASELAGDGKPLAAFGELGLTGELRHVAHADRRLAEAAKFGLDARRAPGDGTTTLREALRGLARSALRHAPHSLKTAAQSQNERMSQSVSRRMGGRCRMPGMT